MTPRHISASSSSTTTAAPARAHLRALLALLCALPALTLACTAEHELGPVDAGAACPAQAGAAAPAQFVDVDGVLVEHQDSAFVGRPAGCNPPEPVMDASACDDPNDLSDCFNPFYSDAGR